MAFDYEKHYKKLISDLTVLLAESIEQIPEQDKDAPPGGTENEEPEIVYYKNKRKPQKPLKLD